MRSHYSISLRAPVGSLNGQTASRAKADLL